MARLWDLRKNATCCEIIVGRRSAYRHRFGGKPTYSGLVPACGGPPIHLLFTFDLSDPKVPFTQPNCPDLPLLYPFEYDGSRFAYKLDGPHGIVIVQQPARVYTPGFPYDEYPEHFPHYPVSLSDHVGINRYFEDPFLCEELVHATSESQKLDDVDRVSLIEGLMQGPPRTACPSPNCNGRPMMLLTILRGDLIDGMNFWSDSEWGPDVDITYEVCPNCNVIYAENQCG